MSSATVPVGMQLMFRGERDGGRFASQQVASQGSKTRPKARQPLPLFRFQDEDEMSELGLVQSLQCELSLGLSLCRNTGTVL